MLIMDDDDRMYRVKPQTIAARSFPSCWCKKKNCRGCRNDKLYSSSPSSSSSHHPVSSDHDKSSCADRQYNDGEHFNAAENQFLREVQEVNTDGTELDVLQKIARRPGGLLQGSAARDNGGFIEGWGTYMNKDRRNRALAEVEDKDRCYYRDGGVPSRVNGGRLLRGYKNAFIRSSDRNADIRGKKDKMF